MSFHYKIDKIIDDYYPVASWYAVDSDSVYETVRLSKNSAEHIRLQLMMMGDFAKKITGIYEVHNPILYAQFLLKIAERSIYGTPTIKELVHCTSEDNADSIMENNFDWRAANRVKFGSGVSFATNPAYANLQSSLKNGVHRAMIVADVIVTGTQYGNKNTVLPDEPYDTSVSKCQNVYVKYYDNEFYPKYVIQYDTFKVVSHNGQRRLKK